MKENIRKELGGYMDIQKDKSRTLEEISEDVEFEILTLEHDDGGVEDCIVIGVFAAVDRNYIALQPLELDADADDEGDEMNVYIYRFECDSEEEFSLAEIDDDEEFELAVSAFYELISA